MTGAVNRSFSKCGSFSDFVARFVKFFLCLLMEDNLPDWTRSPSPDWGVKDDPYLEDDANVKPAIHDELQAEPVPADALTAATPNGVEGNLCSWNLLFLRGWPQRP